MTAEVLDEELDEVAGGPLLSSITVRELFGRYDYEVVVPREGAQPGRLLLLYGDNGSGKTTVLRLLWNLLSPANNKGHRSALVKIPFRTFGVAFSDGSSIMVEKTEGLQGSYQVTLNRPGVELCVVSFTADESGSLGRPVGDIYFSSPARDKTRYNELITTSLRFAGSDQAENVHSEEEFLRFLADSGIKPLYLADDRSLYSDDEGLERARERAAAAPNHPRDRESANSVVERELRLTIGRVNELLRSLTLRGQNVGSTGSNAIYSDVLRQLTILPNVIGPESLPDPENPNSADRLLRALANKSPRFEEFGLVPHFPADEFHALLQGVPPERQRIAHEILAPYLSSLGARMSALEEAEKLLRALLSLLNTFLVDKQFNFTPGHGLRILTQTGERLLPSALSSGERQLTMLLCTTLLARRDSRLFIIDEPELSLGVPWQREILNSLLTLTEGTSLQFIVATHSVEMVSSERQHLVRLRRNPNAVG